MNIKLEIVLFSVVLIFAVASSLWAFNTEKRLKRFFLGKKAKDLEGTLEKLEEDIEKLKLAKDGAEKELSVINKKHLHN